MQSVPNKKAKGAASLEFAHVARVCLTPEFVAQVATISGYGLKVNDAPIWAEVVSGVVGRSRLVQCHA